MTTENKGAWLTLAQLRRLLMRGELCDKHYRCNPEARDGDLSGSLCVACELCTATETSDGSWKASGDHAPDCWLAAAIKEAEGGLNGWTRVKDGLPAIITPGCDGDSALDGLVLIRVASYYQKHGGIDLAMRDHDGWTTLRGWAVPNWDVTHWRPLPPLPEGV